MLKFEWNSEKAEVNFKKHHVSFEEAMTVFNDESALTIVDEEHSLKEERFVNLGFSSKGRLIVVVFTERNDKIRIISLRKATRKEMEYYEKS